MEAINLILYQYADGLHFPVTYLGLSDFTQGRFLTFLYIPCWIKWYQSNPLFQRLEKDLKNTPDFHIMDDLKGEIPFKSIGFFKDCKLYLTIW